MKTIASIMLAAIMLLAPSLVYAQIAPPAPTPPTTQPLIQIALLLDTSSSMSGLINQARTHLWSIVNQFATSTHDGQTPALQVALYEYGNDGLSADDGYIRKVIAFSDDLDAVSEALFSLTTNGGSEFCGQVIAQAVEKLEWKSQNNVFKAIFIAGNEPFTQGPVHYEQACRSAIQKSILVNTIHCGGYQLGIDTKWQHGSQLADGSYLHIDQNRVQADIAAPQDDELTKLNSELNDTYLWFGADADAYLENQARQDSNAITLSASANALRIMTKAGRMYRNNFDLVDALEAESVVLAEVADADLPEAMRDMTLEERKTFVQAQAARRAELQTLIAALSQARGVYVAQERRALADDGGDTLGDAIIAAVREQLDAAGYKLPDEAE